jgi:TolB-like protein
MTDSSPGYRQLFAELKRRRVFRVMAMYGIVGFFLLQIMELAVPALLLPQWTYRLVALILLLGFPVAIVLAWAFDLTPEGIQKTQAAAPGELDAIVSAPAVQRLPAGLLALIGVAALVLGAWWVGTRTAAESGAAATGAAPAEVRLAFTDLADDPRPSIAVLPFVNMSADEDQEYFSDGITEEILNVLTKLSELRVAARTSAFAFKGRQIDVRAVGDSLGVGYLIEGSVRKAGDQLRITAQLIDAADGSHLWSESYDRRLDNVFRIQTEIAEAIADELKVPLGLDDVADLVSPTADLEAYDLYLAARARMRERGKSLRDANQLFKAAIARDSMWAPAWAGLAESLELTGWYFNAWDEMPVDYDTFAAGRDSLWGGAERAARRALQLDPNIASAHVALGSVLRNTRRWEESEAEYLKALNADPDSPEAHQQYGEMLIDTGRIIEGRRAIERAVALDRAPVRVAWHFIALMADNEPEQALEVLQEGLRDAPESSILRYELSVAYATLGRLDDWVGNAWNEDDRERRRRFVDGDLTAVPLAQEGSTEVLAALGRPDSTAARLARQAQYSSLAHIWFPAFDSIREHPVYLQMLRDQNLEGATPSRTPR